MKKQPVFAPAQPRKRMDKRANLYYTKNDVSAPGRGGRLFVRRMPRKPKTGRFDMKKIASKALALLVCACLTASALAGCSDTTWAAKAGSLTAPAGVYLYYLLNAQSSITSGSAGDSGESSTDSSKYWTQKIDGVSAEQWARDTAEKETKELIAAEALCKERKISLTADEKSTLKSTAISMRASYPVLVANHISVESLEQAFGYSYYLKDKLFQSYYGESGTEPVSDADLKTYYTNDFVQIKQIFFSKTNTSTGATLSSSEQKTKKEKAEQVLGQINADKSNFDALVESDNEDSGMESNPDGYIFGKNESYIKVFKDAAFSMKVGDVKLVESSMGYHIMYKVAVDESQFESKKSDVLSDMKHDDFLKKLDNYKVTVNKSTINRYSAKTLRTSSDATSEDVAAASAAASKAEVASSAAAAASSSASSSASSGS